MSMQPSYCRTCGEPVGSGGFHACNGLKITKQVPQATVPQATVQLSDSMVERIALALERIAKALETRP